MGLAGVCEPGALPKATLATHASARDVSEATIQTAKSTKEGKAETHRLDSPEEQNEADARGKIPKEVLTFSWLERKVLLHSPVADAVITELRESRGDAGRLRIIDNIESWNFFFASGNQEALELDMLQLLSTHRYRHLASESSHSAEDRLQQTRAEEGFWRSAKDRLEEYSVFAEKHGRELLIQLEAGESEDA